MFSLDLVWEWFIFLLKLRKVFYKPNEDWAARVTTELRSGGGWFEEQCFGVRESRFVSFHWWGPLQPRFGPLCPCSWQGTMSPPRAVGEPDNCQYCHHLPSFPGCLPPLLPGASTVTHSVPITGPQRAQAPSLHFMRAKLTCEDQCTEETHSHNVFWMDFNHREMNCFPHGLLWSECLCPPKFLCWNLMPKVLVLGIGAFGRWLGHEGGALVMGLVPLEKWPQRTPSPLLPPEDTEAVGYENRK